MISNTFNVISLQGSKLKTTYPIVEVYFLWNRTVDSNLLYNLEHYVITYLPLIFHYIKKSHFYNVHYVLS